MEETRLERIEAKLDAVSTASILAATQSAANTTALATVATDIMHIKLSLAEFRGARRVIGFVATILGAIAGALAAFFAGAWHKR